MRTELLLKLKELCINAVLASQEIIFKDITRLKAHLGLWLPYFTTIVWNIFALRPIKFVDYPSLTLQNSNKANKTNQRYKTLILYQLFLNLLNVLVQCIHGVQINPKVHTLDTNFPVDSDICIGVSSTFKLHLQ